MEPRYGWKSPKEREPVSDKKQRRAGAPRRSNGSRPESPFRGQKIDKEILPLIQALRGHPSVLTLGSCSGHRKAHAYVDLAVDGVAGLHGFVSALNRVHDEFEDEIMLDVALNWSEEVATACDFENYPDWVMLSLTIESRAEAPGPSAKLLKGIAAAFRRRWARPNPEWTRQAAETAACSGHALQGNDPGTPIA